MSLTLLASSDLHLGRRTSGVPESSIQTSAIATWERIVDTAVERRVDAVLLAGDIIDRENDYFESIGPLVKGFKTLSENGISVFLVAGNHDFEVLADAVGQVKSENIQLLGKNGQWQIERLNSEGSVLQVAGRSFTRSTQTSDPLLDFPQKQVDEDLPSVGLVHGEVNASKSEYGPIEKNRLINTRFDAWVIGHIHKPGLLRKQNPLICYPGSPHAFSAREPGTHGPWLLHFKEDRTVVAEKLPLSPVRFEAIELDVSEIGDKAQFRNLLRTRLMENAKKREINTDKVHYLIFDVWLVGSVKNTRRMESWGKEVTNYYEEVTGTDLMVSVRKVRTRFTTALDGLEEWARQNNPAGLLADTLLKLRNGDSNEMIEELIDQWKIEMERINRSDVFRPLLQEERRKASSDSVAREHLRRECERLLHQLVQQQENQEGN